MILSPLFVYGSLLFFFSLLEIKYIILYIISLTISIHLDMILSPSPSLSLRKEK